MEKDKEQSEGNVSTTTVKHLEGRMQRGGGGHRPRMVWICLIHV